MIHVFVLKTRQTDTYRDPKDFNIQDTVRKLKVELDAQTSSHAETRPLIQARFSSGLSSETHSVDHRLPDQTAEQHIDSPGHVKKRETWLPSLNRESNFSRLTERVRTF